MMSLEVIDRGAIHGLHNHASFPWLSPVMVGLAYLGSRYVVAGLTLVGGLALAASGQRRAALLLVVTVALAFGLGHATRVVVDRDGPNLGWERDYLPAEYAKSFPSGKALGTTALFGSLALLLSRRLPPGNGRSAARLGGLLLPFLIGYACMYVGHNFVSDVLAGWAGGAALALLCGWVDERSTAPLAA
jgi:undecaprenyl-diphosphatase